MPRPKRPGGTFSTEWPRRLNAFFGQHKRLTKKGASLVLSDIAYEQGYRSISAQMLYKYCNTNENRRPTDHFMACWAIFEERLRVLKGKELMCRAHNGQHLIIWLDGQAEEIWLPPTSQWALHRCKQCRIAYIGQHNSHHCPTCRHPARRDQPNRGEDSLMAILDVMRLDYTFNTFRIGRYLYDFRLLDYPILIEYDGEYWHHSKQAKEHGTPRRDARKTMLAEKAGFTLIRIREHEMKNPNVVENKIWRTLRNQAQI